MMADDCILETQGLTKEFSGFTAVSDVNLRVRRGDIHALIGPNGAGKTTVFNLLTKVLTPSSGRIFYRGRDITGLAPAKVARLGVVRSFQISSVFPYMSALENVRIALQRPLGVSFRFWRSDKVLNDLNGQAMEALSLVGLERYADILALELPYGHKRALEIATTLALSPELMLLDEPMAGMGAEDVAQVAQLIKKVSVNRTILMVEHNLNVVAEISDRITVLQRGCILVEGSYSEVSQNPAVVEAYIGRAHRH
ncbi:MAG TPA: ABC transporter ATP-binding protein [Gammaproteobacteria bacterium]|nr:ABC transporter ATP-binding protein [Gammaproteobacteria bacterium]